MELTLQAPAIALETQNTNPVAYSKYILRIDNGAPANGSDYVQEQIYFSKMTLREAIAKCESASHPPDAILINPKNIADEISQLRDVAQKRAIPLILFTSKYDKSVKDLAFEITADDYYYGSITPSFLKRLDFIKKLKTYKIERGNKPYAIRHTDQVPQIEFWSMKRAFDILISATALLVL